MRRISTARARRSSNGASPKKPVEVYARSIDKVLGPLYKGIDATAGLISFEDGTLYHLNMSWALPVTWPPAVYSLEVGIVGTTGVDNDSHRDR